MTPICSIMKHQYAIRTHVCSMRLADTLKVLLKSNVLTKTVIASQGKNDVTEASVTILNRDDCSNFFHCWQILKTPVTSFDQTHSHGRTDNNVRCISFCLIIITIVFMVAQYLMCMTIYTCERIALNKHS